jgi:RNA polymerase sigma-70 factor (ECF subfamily)
MNKELFWKLLEPVHPEAEAFARYLAGSREDGDDLYQDSLLTAFRKRDMLKNETSFKPWLFRIIVNQHKNRCRHPWWRRRRNLEAIDIDKQMVTDPGSNYSLNRWLKRALSVLSQEDRAMIILYEIEGWPIGDLSRMMSRPEGTIKARLFRARIKMRKVLTGALPPEQPKSNNREGEYAVSRSNPTAE